MARNWNVCYQWVLSKSHRYGIGFFAGKEVCDLKNNIVKTEVTGHLLVHFDQLKITHI